VSLGTARTQDQSEVHVHARLVSRFAAGRNSEARQLAAVLMDSALGGTRNASILRRSTRSNRPPQGLGGLRGRLVRYRGKRRRFTGVWFISSSPDSPETGRSSSRSTRLGYSPRLDPSEREAVSAEQGIAFPLRDLAHHLQFGRSKFQALHHRMFGFRSHRFFPKPERPPPGCDSPRNPLSRKEPDPRTQHAPALRTFRQRKPA
jgi:hypothetical protein